MSTHKTVAVQVLRNIVSSVFKIPARAVRLEEREIDPQFKAPQSSLGGGMWDDESRTTIWGFSPEVGFVYIPKVEYRQWNDGFDGPPQDDSHQAMHLHEVEGVESFVFFLLYRNYSYSCPYNSRSDYYEEWSLYKAPDFAQYWAKVGEEDLKRWEEWIK